MLCAAPTNSPQHIQSFKPTFSCCEYHLNSLLHDSVFVSSLQIYKVVMSNPESGEDIPVSKLSQHVVVNMHNVPCRERRFGCIVYDENSQINLDLPQENVTYKPGDKLEIKTNHLGILAAYEGFDHQSKIPSV